MSFAIDRNKHPENPFLLVKKPKKAENKAINISGYFPQQSSSTSLQNRSFTTSIRQELLLDEMQETFDLFSASAFVKSLAYQNKDFRSLSKMDVSPELPSILKFIQLEGCPEFLKPHLFFFIYYAVHNDKIYLAKDLLSQFPAFLDMCDSEGNTPLHWVCSAKMRATTDIKPFITQKNLTRKNQARKNPLVLAAISRNQAIFRQLFFHPSVIIDYFSRVGFQDNDPSLIEIRQLPNKYLALLCEVDYRFGSYIHPTRLQSGETEIKNYDNYENWDPVWLEFLFIKRNSSFTEFFHFAEQNGKLPLLKLILSRFDFNFLERIFFKSAHRNQWKQVEWLLKVFPQLWAARIEKNSNILFIAIRLKNLGFIKKCIMNVRELFSQKDDDNKSPLDYLLTLHPDWVEGIQLFSQIKMKIKQNYLNEALDQTIGSENSAATTALLKLAAEERRKGTIKVFPLHIAFRENSLEIALNLMQVEEDLDVGDETGATILHYACRYIQTIPPEYKVEFQPLFETLVDRGDKDGNTPVHLVAMRGNESQALELLALGANFNAQNHLGNTPLHVAVASGQLDKMDFLLSLGAYGSLFIKNKEGQIPLHIAVKKGDLLAVNKLSGRKGALLELDRTQNFSQFLFIPDNEGKNPLALALENHHFHLLPSLLQYTDIGNLLGTSIDSTMEPKQLIDVLRSPMSAEQFDWYLLAPFLFHDVRYADKLFEHLTEKQFVRSMRYLKKQFPPSLSEWLEAERLLVKWGMQMNSGIYQRLPSTQILPAPDYADFTYACYALRNMTDRIQDKDPRKPGFTKISVREIQCELDTVIFAIEKRSLARALTGEPGTSECARFYQSLENMLIYVAILLSGESCPVRTKMQEQRRREGKPPLPLLDDDYCASALVEIAKSIQVCATGRAGSFFMAYDLLNDKVKGSSSLSDTRSWEADVLLYMNRYREEVVNWVIRMQKKENGEEFSEEMDIHIALQVRSLLKDRGIRESNLNQTDPFKMKHITKEKVEKSFDQFFSMSALLQMMDEGINGRKGPDGKRVGKPVFDMGKMLDWLRDHYSTPEELQRQEKCKELVAAFEQKQQERAREIAETLGVAGITYREAVLLADKLRMKIEKEFSFNEETNEWGMEGIAKMMTHPKIGIFKKKEEGRGKEEGKEEGKRNKEEEKSPFER